MRVLVVTSEWPRGEGDSSGMHVVSQVAHLRAAGVEVDVFPLRARHDPRRCLATARSLRRGPSAAMTSFTRTTCRPGLWGWRRSNALWS